MTGTAKDRLEDKHKFTVELLLYSLSFGLALALRLLALERWPLLDEEAGLALAAWRFAHGLPASLSGHSPLLFHGNALLFFLTNGSDNLARSWCVLFGSLLVLLPYGLRRNLGKTGALAASWLLAISPSFTYFSRAVDGSIVVAFCALGLLVAIAGYLEKRHPAYVFVMATLLVLAIMAGPSAYTMLAVLLTFPLFLRLWAKFAKDRTPLDELGRAWHDLSADSRSWRGALFLAGLLFLGIGLAFTLNPLGLQMTLDQLGRWLRGFDFLRRSPWYRSLQLLLLYEALPFVCGVASLFVERARRDTFGLLLGYWFIFTLLFSIVPGYRPPSSVLLILVPLILLAGQAMENLWQGLRMSLRHPLFWVLVTLSLVIVAAAYVQFAVYLLAPMSVYLLRIAALCVFAVSAYAMLWSVLGPEVPLRAAVISLLLLLLLGLIRTEARLNYVQARDPVEPMVGMATSPDVLELARQAAQLSSHLKGDARAMTWQVDERLEVPLGWYLRNFEQVDYVSKVATEPDAEAVIVPADAPAPARYVGLRFRLRSIWMGGGYPIIEWVRWWTGYKSALAGYQSGDDVMLWVSSSSEQAAGSSE